jgi:hypothetical protein
MVNYYYLREINEIDHQKIAQESSIITAQYQEKASLQSE